jgi:hypothetical protein
MSNKNQFLLVLERSSGNLAASKEGEKYVLEGIFTEVGKKNKNNRIYDEKELIPHINEMKQKLKGNKLLGELDHPKSFDISLKNASHVIESIDYDPTTKLVTGRIKLLNTDAGKQAQALVDAEIPLHISSRAAGVVESDGHVKIKKMFTYDLVADPGFANAEMKRVNESFGFTDDGDVQIYEIPNTISINDVEINDMEEITNNTNLEKHITETKNTEMDNKKYISVDDFNEYSKIVKNEMNSIKASLTESNNETKNNKDESLVKYTETVANRVNKVQEYLERLAESVDGLISHNDYIVENLEKVKDYAEMVGEKTNQGINYSEKLAESVDHLIDYTKLVAEKTDQSIEFTNHIASESNNRWDYQSYMNEQLDNVISHNDYIVEGTSSVIEYTDYLKEHTENLTNYVGHIVESINESEKTDTTESTKINEESVKQEEETPVVESTVSFEEKINTQIDNLLETAKAQKEASINENKLHFLNFLSESKRNQFDSLQPDMKDKVIGIFESSKFYGSVDVNRIYEGIFLTTLTPLNYLSNMPEKYKKSWLDLNESQKNSIKAQASVKVLDTQYKIDNFWETRDLRATEINVNESSVSLPINETSDYKTPDTYMDAVTAGFRKRFKK